MFSVSVGVRIPSNLYEKLMAHYLESTEDIPLSKRVADLEAKVEELQVLVKK